MSPPHFTSVKNNCSHFTTNRFSLASIVASSTEFTKIQNSGLFWMYVKTFVAIFAAIYLFQETDFKVVS